MKVAIIDDQSAIRDGFARVVRAQDDMELVGLGATGRDAVDIAHEHAPDVMVMDIRMPILDGIAATREILSAGLGGAPCPPRILIVTTFNLDEYVYNALRAGASGFILKDAGPSQMIDAIRTISRGDALVDPAVTRTLIGAYAGRLRPRTESADSAEMLTPREREVLRLLAQGMSNIEIAAAMVVTRETTKTYVSRILLKLGLRDRVQAVVYAYRSGIADE